MDGYGGDACRYRVIGLLSVSGPSTEPEHHLHTGKSCLIVLPVSVSRVTCHVAQPEYELMTLQVCYIEYEPRAYNETVEVCRTPVMKDCQVSQPPRRHVGGV